MLGRLYLKGKNVREKPKLVLFRRKDGLKAHIYASGEAYVKSREGRTESWLRFSSFDDAVGCFKTLGYEDPRAPRPQRHMLTRG